MLHWSVLPFIFLILQENVLRWVLCNDEAVVRDALLQPAGDKGLEESAVIRRLLLVGAVDGILYAFDKYSGALLWASEELGGPLIIRKSQDSVNGPLYLVEPQEGGPLYVYLSDSGIKKLPLTMRELVDQSPVRWPDGTFFLGRKATQFFALDMTNGRLVAKYEWGSGGEVTVPSAKVFEAFSGRSRSLILISRTDISVSCFAPSAEDMATPTWEVSFSQYGGFVNPFTARAQENSHVPLCSTPFSSQSEHQIVYSSINGIIAARDPHTLQLMWIRKMPSIALSFFRLSEPLLGEEAMGPVIVKVPIARKADAKEGKANEMLVTVGEYDGSYFVLPSDQFPFIRQSFAGVPNSQRLLSRANESVLISDISLSQPLSTVTATAESFLRSNALCMVDSPDFPACLAGNYRAKVLMPIRLLSAGETNFAAQQTLRFASYVLTGIVVLVSLAFWTYRALRGRTRPVSVDPSLIGLRPPGFEEISLSSADIFYSIQSEDSLDRSPPRSFTVTDEVIGYGSHGTVVFKGFYDGIAVAVKRMLVDFYELAGHEVSLLQQSDHHPNVIRYHCRERTEKFTYIVLELCTCSLADIIEGRSTTARVPSVVAELESSPQAILEQITKGLAHLHTLKLVHRDIKPHNILVTPKGRIVISDFGLGKKLADDQSFFNPTMQAGTIGWRAPECILGEEAQRLAQLNEQKGAAANQSLRLSKSVDIFALGCVFYYVLSRGNHPFGDRLHREMNIVNTKLNLEKIRNKPEAYDLITRMLERKPERRPTSDQILKHPYFWSAQKQVAFLQDLSDKFEIEDRKPHSTILESFEMRKRVIFEGSPTWNRLLDSEVWYDLCNYRKYNAHSARDLLRALRNKRNHFHELTLELKAILGDTPEAFMNYFLTRFPRLLIESYHLVESTELRNENPFAAIYF